MTVRFAYFFDLADGVGEDEGERWYRDLFVQERELPGVRRVAAYRTRSVPQPEDVRRPLSAFHRMVEVEVDDEATWAQEHAALLEREAKDVVGTLRGILSPVAPEYDLLRDVPPQHYPYLTQPLDWKTGRRPQVPEPDGSDLWRYVYFFSYADGVDLDAGEDWYVGHHTREGKQLPGLVRYLTWRRLGPPTGAGGWVDEARRFVRVTELCFESFETWYRVCYPEGLRWTMPQDRPRGVWGDYEAFFVGPTPDLVHDRRTGGDDGEA